MLGFECVERCCVAQSQADVVEAFEQAELAEGIDFEGRVKSAAVGDGLVFKRDGELIVRESSLRC